MGSNRLPAAILAGGQSRRMGQNKALLTIPPDGKTIVETVVGRLRDVADEIVLVGSEAEPYAFLDLPWITDVPAGIGPLGGIHAALTATRSSHLLVVACDMPFLNSRLLAYMASQPRDYDVLMPRLDQPQPMHAIYSKSCLPVIEQHIHAGAHKVTGWLDQVNVRPVDRELIERYDPAFLSWFNVNTPEDYARALGVLESNRD